MQDTASVCAVPVPAGGNNDGSDRWMSYTERQSPHREGWVKYRTLTQETRAPFPCEIGQQ